VIIRGATTSLKLGVQFLGLPSTEKIDRSTQFGAVGYIITLYSSKSYVKSWGSVQILGRSAHNPLVVSPMMIMMMMIKFFCRHSLQFVKCGSTADLSPRADSHATTRSTCLSYVVLLQLYYSHSGNTHHLPCTVHTDSRR